MQSWSRAKWRPRSDAGTSSVTQGSQAALAMPRDTLKASSRDSSSTSRVAASRKPPVTGTAAIRKMIPTRSDQPPSTKRR
jgi:hypothetical protein